MRIGYVLLKRLSVFLFVLSAVVLFVGAGFSVGHSSGFNHPWTTQYLAVFGNDTLLPRHLPGLWSGLGGYDFFFYAPIPFWVTAASIAPMCPNCSVGTEIVLGVALFWVLSGVTFYIFARRYCEPACALAGAVAYAVLPYHLLLDWFVRQAIGEFAAYAFIPLIAFGLDAIRLGQRHAWVFAAGVAGVILCHLPTALLTAHVVLVVAAVMAWHNARNAKAVLRPVMAVIGWGGLGALLSCFYWLPALVLLEHVASDLLYTDHYLAERWLYGWDFDQPDPEFARTILWSFLAVLPVLLASVFRARGGLLIWIVVPALFVTVLNLEASAFVWTTWIIERVQFPWRLMVFVDFSAAIAVAVLFKSAVSQRWRAVLLLCALLAIVPVLKVGEASRVWIITPYDTDRPQAGAPEYLSPELVAAIRAGRGFDDEGLRDRRAIFDFTRAAAVELSEAIAPVAEVHVSHRQVTVRPHQEVERISVPVQYWAFWQAEMDGGQPVALSPNGTFGTIDLMAPEGGFQGRAVTLMLPYHWSEWVGFAVSLAAVLLGVTFGLRSSRTYHAQAD
ncbi:hypothetical protein [Roseobacter sp. A03A-229]